MFKENYLDKKNVLVFGYQIKEYIDVMNGEDDLVKLMKIFFDDVEGKNHIFDHIPSTYEL